MIKPLGILYYNYKIVNHRSLLKILLNPILRCFGLALGSNCEDNKVIGLKLFFDKTGFNLNIFKNYYNSLYTCNKYDFILKKRRIF